MTDVDEAAWLRDALREELVHLWTDLEHARREAINGTWSIRCDALAARIGSITQLVGPASWDYMPLALLMDGVYQRLHAELGVDAPVDPELIAETKVWNDSWRRR